MAFIEYLKKNKLLVACSVLSAIFTWGYALTNFTRTIDEERIISRSTNLKLWIGDGRYTIALLRGLLPYENIPYYHTFLFIVVLVIAALFLCYFLNELLPNSYAVSFCAMLFISMPTHAYYESFCTYCEEIAMGYLLSIISIYFIYLWISYKERTYLAIAVGLEVIVLGIYQGFISVYIILTCAVFLLMIIRQNEIKYRRIWINLLCYIGVLCVSVVVSLIISQLLKLSLHITQTYVDSYFMWGKNSISSIFKEIQCAIMGISIYPTAHRGYITIPLANALLLIVWGLGFVRYKKNRVLFTMGCMGLFFSNIFFFIVMGGYMPPRIMLAAPLYLAILIYIISYIIQSKGLKYLLLTGSIIMCLYQSFTAIDLNRIADNAQQDDYAKVTAVSEDIARLGLGYIPKKPIAFTGVPVDYSAQMNEGDSNMGYSYFTLGRVRLQDYFSSYGFTYQWCSEEQQVNAEMLAATLPRWPQEGSVVEYDDMIVVNLQDIWLP